MSFIDDSSDPDWKGVRHKSMKIGKSDLSGSQSKTKYLQKFCDKWLNIFHPWLARSDEDRNKPFCRACQTTLDCNRCHLQRHERTTKHARNLEILINKGENAARQNLCIRRERSKYYQQRRVVNSMSVASFDTSEVGLEGTEDYIEDFDGDVKMSRKSEIKDDIGMEYIHTEMEGHQYEEEITTKQESLSPVSNADITPRSVKKMSVVEREPKKAALKERLKLFMQIQKDKNDLMESFKELVGSNNFSGSPPKEKNHVDLFFESVSSSVKALSPKLIAEAKMRVSQILMELELRGLTESSSNASTAGHTLVVTPQAATSYSVINQVATVDNQALSPDESGHHYETLE